MGDVRSAISQHIVDTAVNCLFLVPAVNYSQDVNLTTVPLHLSSVSNPSHSWANVTYFNMDPYLHRRYDLQRLLVITTHTIAIVHIRRLSNRMVRLPIQFRHPDLQYSHVPLVNHINHDRMHHSHCRPLSLSTWGPACRLFSPTWFNSVIRSWDRCFWSWSRDIYNITH